MKVFLLLSLFYLQSCGIQSVDTAVVFHRNLPDTIKSWAGQMTKESYHQTRTLEAKFGLKTLSSGTPEKEIRVWNFSGSYDPQVLFILKNDSVSYWQLRTISFYRSKGDSIYADCTRKISQNAIDSLNLNRYWTMASQSDLKAGESYGCMDGGEVFIELASAARYRIMWYRCPDINKDNDSVFYLANELTKRLDGLAVDH